MAPTKFNKEAITVHFTWRYKTGLACVSCQYIQKSFFQPWPQPNRKSVILTLLCDFCTFLDFNILYFKELFQDTLLEWPQILQSKWMWKWKCQLEATHVTLWLLPRLNHVRQTWCDLQQILISTWHSVHTQVIHEYSVVSSSLMLEVFVRWGMRECKASCSPAEGASVQTLKKVKAP